MCFLPIFAIFTKILEISGKRVLYELKKYFWIIFQMITSFQKYSNNTKYQQSRGKVVGQILHLLDKIPEFLVNPLFLFHLSNNTFSLLILFAFSSLQNSTKKTKISHFNQNCWGIINWRIILFLIKYDENDENNNEKHVKWIKSWLNLFNLIYFEWKNCWIKFCIIEFFQRWNMLSKYSE